MIKIEQRLVQQNFEEAIQCDRCQKIFETNDSEFHEMHRIDFIAGFASAFGDGNRVQCELCSECLYELIAEFCRKDAVQ